MKLSVVIPVYNEEQTIGEVVERVLAWISATSRKELIISNDGSSDGTRSAIDDSRWAADPRIKVHHNQINLGKGAAVRLGLHYASGDILLVQDADLELDPQEYGGCWRRSSPATPMSCTGPGFCSRRIGFHCARASPIATDVADERAVFARYGYGKTPTRSSAARCSTRSGFAVSDSISNPS